MHGSSKLSRRGFLLALPATAAAIATVPPPACPVARVVLPAPRWQTLHALDGPVRDTRYERALFDLLKVTNRELEALPWIERP